MATGLREVVDEANQAGRVGRRLPASARSLGLALYVSKTKVNEVLLGQSPSVFDEDLVLQIVRRCRELAGRELDQDEAETWRHRVRSAATATALALAADKRLDTGAGALLVRVARTPAPRGPHYLPARRHSIAWPRRRARRVLALLAVLSAVAMVTAVSVVVAGRGPSEKELAALTLASAPCPDPIAVDGRYAADPPWVYDSGPYLAVSPDRRVELHFTDVSPARTVAWARLARSASAQDTVSLSWSYVQDSADDQSRTCGPYSITGGKDTPAVPVNDRGGRKRWFRACANVPAGDWAPGADHGSFCTGSQRPPGD